MKIKKEINKLVKKYKSVFAQEDKYKFALMLHLGPATKPFEIGSKYKLLTPSQFIDTSVAFIKNKKYKLYGILLKPKKKRMFYFLSKWQHRTVNKINMATEQLLSSEHRGTRKKNKRNLKNLLRRVLFLTNFIS